MKLFILLFLFNLYLISNSSKNLNKSNSLIGAIYLEEPYAYMENGKLVGFSIDLMDEIARLAGLNLTYYHNSRKHQGYQWVIGEIFDKKRADFGFGNFPTDLYYQYVDYTEPILEDNYLTAVVSRRIAQEKQLCTVEDLLTNQLNIGSGQGVSSILFLQTRPHLFVKNITESIWKDILFFSNYSVAHNFVKRNKGALIYEANVAEYYAGLDCELTILPDNSAKLLLRKLAIPFQNESPYLDKFNLAIRALKADGTVENLRAKYWTNQCSQSLYYCN